MIRMSVTLVAAALFAVSIGCDGASQPEPAPGGGSTSAAPAAAPAAPEPSPAPEAEPQPAIVGDPILVVDTAKGIIEIQTYPAEAPKTVAHITELAKRNFYNGLRVHRVEPGFVVQFGDPQTRDMTKRDRWGNGGSGKPIGVGEPSAKHKHVVGAVAMAHPGNPNLADSQMYIMLGTAARLDGGYTVFGQVISGMDVVRKLVVPDIIKRISVKGGA